MNKYILLLGILIAVIFTSCETDIDVNAEYEDMPIVYGLISPKDTTHYVKITRNFLGEVDANTLAADPDNFNYPAGDLDVVVKEYNSSGALVNSFSLARTVNEIPKDPGVFGTGSNVLYKFNTTFDYSGAPSDRNNTFKIQIHNNKLNKDISSETKIVKPISVGIPNSTKFNLWNGAVTTGDYLSKTVPVTTSNNTGRVEAILVFNYVEYYTTASGLSPVAKSVVMSLGEQKTKGTDSETLQWEVLGETFFDNIKNKVPLNVPFLSHRELQNMSFNFNVAGTELSTYMTVSAPSTSINQDKPSYTNITNGLGVFSSRENALWLSSHDNVSQVNLSNSTISFLKSLGRGFCFGTSSTSGFKCNQQ